jgi:GMP synthase (glutamine-hydrolysing)
MSEGGQVRLDAVALLHAPDEGLARLGPALQAAGFRCRERLRSVEPADVDAPLVVVMGGEMGVYDADHEPYLAAEIALLRSRLAADRPCLGICLGSQLLAAAAGATVRRGDPGMVVGVRPVQRVPAGLKDPALEGVPEEFDVVHWHGDTFQPAPGTPLFRGETYPAQGFRVGRSIGLQFHPELGPAEFRSWVEALRDPLRRSGRDPDRLLAEGLPRLERALGALDRLLAGVAGDMRRAAGA